MLLLETIAPVFLIVVLGAWLQRSGFVSPGFLREVNKLNYWVGLPALLFSQLAPALPSAAGVKPALTAMLLATVAVMFAAWLVAAALRLPGPVAGTFVQGIYRGNLAFVGLPVIFALPDTPVGGLTLHEAAIVIIAPAMLLYNVAGVVVLLAGQHRLSPAMLKPMVRQLAVTPPFLAIVAGMTFALLGWHLPVALDHTLRALGEMTLPLGLLAVGGSLGLMNVGRNWRLPAGAAVLKTTLSPAIGWLFARAWGLDPALQKAVMIYMATPTAIVSYTMALELKGDDQLASGVIAMSTVASLFALGVIVACL